MEYISIPADSGEDLLDNWGRWSRGGTAHFTGIHPIIIICENLRALAIKSGRAVPVESFGGQEEPRRATSEEKALATDRVISRAFTKLEKAIAKMRYVRMRPDNEICKRLRIPKEDLPEFISIMKRKLVSAI